MIQGSPQVRALVLLAAAACLAACGGGGPEGGVDAVFGSRGRQLGQFLQPRAIAIDSNEQAVVVDRSGRVQVFQLPGFERVANWMLPAWDNGTPTGIALDPLDETVWIADTHYQRLLHYARDGRLLGAIGKYGTGPGEFIFPTDLALTPDGQTIWVTEYGERNRLMKFARTGEFLAEYAGPAYQKSELARPMSVEIGANGLIYIADAAHHQVAVFGQDGEPRFRFGGPGDGPGELRYPYDLAITPNGDVYVCEYGNDRVSRFTAEGEFLGHFGSGGNLPGRFFSPWGLAVSAKGTMLVADTNNNRLQLVRDAAAVVSAGGGPRT
ncbi:MAG: 6-bladed beta-propeller [Candidatus Sumerlaeia bacterium]|nr:6-bladed beta-propeller [Candidatus Sumerlaeia bacterium]